MSLLSPEVLELMRCPETMQKLALASEETLERIRDVGVPVKVGSQFSGPLEAGLIREDGKVLYPICDGIPLVMVEEAIPVPNVIS